MLFQIDHNLDIAATKYWFMDIQINFEESYKELKQLDIRSTYPWPTTDGFIYFYGQPRKNANIFSLVSIFSPLLWGLILLSAFCSFLFFELACLSYKTVNESRMVKETKTFTLLLRVFSSLTEPDSMNIFLGWSTGNLFFNCYCH